MHKINESEINKNDVSAIFKAAAKTEKPGIMGRVFKGLRKPTVDINDLQQAWASEGYPDDTRDIAAILKGHGFKKEAIDKIFTQVFGADKSGNADVPTQGGIVQEIADYAKKKGIDQELIKFLETEYGFTESYSHNGKAVVEDIRQIFTLVVKEERSGRDQLIREQDKLLLGRIRKCM